MCDKCGCDETDSAASLCYAAMWIACGDKMPESGMECVVLVQYSEDDEPFTAIAKYELQKEDSLGRKLGGAEYAYGWNDYFECDVLAWFPVPSYFGMKLRIALAQNTGEAE